MSLRARSAPAKLKILSFPLCDAVLCTNRHSKVFHVASSQEQESVAHFFVPCARINVCTTTRKVNKACLAQVKPRDVLWFLVECRVLLATGPVCLSCGHYSHLAGLSTLFFTIFYTAQTLNCCQCLSGLGFNSQHSLKAAFIPVVTKAGRTATLERLA